MATLQEIKSALDETKIVGSQVADAVRQAMATITNLVAQLAAAQSQGTDPALADSILTQINEVTANLHSVLDTLSTSPTGAIPPGQPVIT